MPKSLHIFLFLIVTCSLLVCLYFSEIEENVSRRFGPHSLGSNLRNLRSSEEISSLTGAILKVTPSSFVKDGEREYQNNTAQFVYKHSANISNSNLLSTETIHLAVIFCNVEQKAALKWNFKKMMRSLIRHCPGETALHFHLVTDLRSWEIAKELIHREIKKTDLNVQVIYLLLVVF